MKLAVLLFVLLVARAVYSCQPPDCDTPDCGSCGNACCCIAFTMPDLTPDKAYNAIVDSLKKGGADTRYTFVEGDDYRKYNESSGVQYQLQAIHRTLVHHYNDTLDMLVIKPPGSTGDHTVLKAFSISRIAGAYCDYGQNYKNLVGFVKGLSVKFTMEIVYGCKNKPPSLFP